MAGGVLKDRAGILVDEQFGADILRDARKQGFITACRAIGGRACPRTVEIDGQTLGTIFYDTDAQQSGGSGVFFRALPTARLAK